MTRTRSGSSGTYNNFDSIGHLKARSGTVARKVAMLKDQKQYRIQTFRLARIGPGWVIGSHEALSGIQSQGVTVAVDCCRLYYISFLDLKELEKEKPMLILQLYKLLSKLETRQSDVHLGQFATLHNIMAAPSHNQPMTTRGILARQHS
jgi:CRP-like cAMP-binding protein